MKAVKNGNQIWVAFNKTPGGQICVQHFEDLEGDKKQGENEVHVEVSAEEQVKSFKLQDDVCVNVNGVIKLHEVLTHPHDPSLQRNKNAADVVIEWAKKQGLKPIQATADQKGTDPKTYEYDKRISSLEGDVKEIKGSLDKILEAVGAAK